jgi:hypothetical protein
MITNLIGQASSVSTKGTLCVCVCVCVRARALACISLMFFSNLFVVLKLSSSTQYEYPLQLANTSSFPDLPRVLIFSVHKAGEKGLIFPVA